MRSDTAKAEVARRIAANGPLSQVAIPLRRPDGKIEIFMSVPKALVAALTNPIYASADRAHCEPP